MSFSFSRSSWRSDLHVDKLTSTNRTVGPAGARQLLLDGAASLFPGYFALVMATGVVSIACHFMGLRALYNGVVKFTNVVVPAV